jgi:hypothetical protein
MTDPISVAASIAGLTSLALELTKGAYSCYKFYKSTKEAKSQILELINQLDLLCAQLQDIKRIVDRASQPLISTQGLLSDVEKCSLDIENFCKLLDPDFSGFSGKFRQLKWPTKKENINSFLSKIRDYQSIFESAKLSDTLRLAEEAVSISNHAVELLKSEKQRSTNQEEEDVWTKFLHWISPQDLNQLEDLQKDICFSKRAGQSCDWILTDRSFKAWRDNSTEHLWCYGDPGIGKTVISCVLVPQKFLALTFF